MALRGILIQHPLASYLTRDTPQDFLEPILVADQFSVATKCQTVVALSYRAYVYPSKLDGVGHVDNGHSIDYLHHFV